LRRCLPLSASLRACCTEGAVAASRDQVFNPVRRAHRDRPRRGSHLLVPSSGGSLERGISASMQWAASLGHGVVLIRQRSNVTGCRFQQLEARTTLALDCIRSRVDAPREGDTCPGRKHLLLNTHVCYVSGGLERWAAGKPVITDRIDQRHAKRGRQVATIQRRRMLVMASLLALAACWGSNSSSKSSDCSGTAAGTLLGNNDLCLLKCRSTTITQAIALLGKPDSDPSDGGSGPITYTYTCTHTDNSTPDTLSFTLNFDASSGVLVSVVHKASGSYAAGAVPACIAACSQ